MKITRLYQDSQSDQYNKSLEGGEPLEGVFLWIYINEQSIYYYTAKLVASLLKSCNTSLLQQLIIKT